MTPISASAMYHRMFEAMTASQLVHPHSFEQVKDSLDGAVFHMRNYVTFIKNRAEVVVRTDECDSVLTMSEPLFANVFLNGVDQMLERAQEAIPLDDQTLGPDNASRELSRKQEKKRQAAVSDLKTRVKALLAAKKSSSESPEAFVEPRYDEVFLKQRDTRAEHLVEYQSLEG